MDSIFHGQYDNDMIFDMRDYDLFAIVLQKNGGCTNMVIASNLVGGLNPSEKYESQLGLLFPICGKNNPHVPNHQPAIFRTLG